MCEICQKLTRETPDQMCEAKFLQMCLFPIILSSLHLFNLSFVLLFYVIYTAILKFPPRSSALPPLFPTFFAFPLRFPAFPRWFPAPALPSHSSRSHPYSLRFPIPHFGFYRYPVQFVIFKTLFQEISYFSSKADTSLWY